MMEKSSNKTLFIVRFGSLHWCGGDSEVLVWAETEEEAQFLAEPHMDEHMRSLFTYDENSPEDQEIGEDEFYYPTVYGVEVFLEGEHGSRQWYEVVGKS